MSQKLSCLQVLAIRFASRNSYFIWGRFDQFRRNIPYSAIIDALQKLVQQLLGEPDEQMEECGDHISTLFQGEMSSIEEGVEADGCQILNTIGVLPTSSFQVRRNLRLSAFSGEQSRQYALTGSQNWSNCHRFIGRLRVKRPINQPAKLSYISPLKICQLNANLGMPLQLKRQLLKFLLIPVA
ncbi:hypothetical protein H6F61_03105 [Cyanobacteria bacterium FACHB-472]|nr:hypothetical protein [Cyanobacteria bacterium FACHB-472]